MISTISETLGMLTNYESTAQLVCENILGRILWNEELKNTRVNIHDVNLPVIRVLACYRYQQKLCLYVTSSTKPALLSNKLCHPKLAVLMRF